MSRIGRVASQSHRPARGTNPKNGNGRPSEVMRLIAAGRMRSAADRILCLSYSPTGEEIEAAVMGLLRNPEDFEANQTRILLLIERGMNETDGVRLLSDEEAREIDEELNVRGLRDTAVAPKEITVDLEA